MVLGRRRTRDVDGEMGPGWGPSWARGSAGPRGGHSPHSHRSALAWRSWHFPCPGRSLEKVVLLGSRCRSELGFAWTHKQERQAGSSGPGPLVGSTLRCFHLLW